MSKEKSGWNIKGTDFEKEVDKSALEMPLPEHRDPDKAIKNEIYNFVEKLIEQISNLSYYSYDNYGKITLNTPIRKDALEVLIFPDDTDKFGDFYETAKGVVNNRNFELEELEFPYKLIIKIDTVKINSLDKKVAVIDIEKNT